jgi:hypothetical protein
VVAAVAHPEIRVKTGWKDPARQWLFLQRLILE